MCPQINLIPWRTLFSSYAKPTFLSTPPSSPQPHLLSLETYSSSFNIWLKRQHISEVFLDNHKSLRLCPVCESEQCYFLILFIYTIFFKPVTEDKKKRTFRAMSTDGESILFGEESRSYLKASCGTQTRVAFTSFSCEHVSFLQYSVLL